MPNPLLSALNRVQVPKVPQPIEPKPEQYEYVDYDGLGMQDDLAEGPQGYTGTAIPVHRDPPPADPDPIAVSIVVDETRSREFTEWGGYVTTIDGNPQRIVSREKRRTRVKIKNLDTVATLWIGPTPSVSKWGGFPIPPGQSEELTSTEAIYGVSDTGAQINVAVLNHWSVNVDK